MNKAKTYSKYFVKRKPGSKEPMVNEDGSPVLGDLVKNNIRISQYKADILNAGWDNKELYVTFYYVEQEEKQVENDRDLAVKEAEELGVKILPNAPLEEIQMKIHRAKLFIQAEKLGLSPSKNMKTEKLEELINEEKG